MKVLVTGGTGFIGSTLVRHLIAAGHEVRVLVRQKKDSFLLQHLDVEVVNGDVTNLPAVEEAVRGCSVVFNLASLYAFFPFWNKYPRAIYKINVGGTTHMLSAALKYGVKKFIHTSTIAALSAKPGGLPTDETSGFDFRGASHYACSKYLAEQEVLKYCGMGLPAVILNPAIVVGERDYKPTPTGDVIVKFLNRSYPCYFDTCWTLADADDVAQAHLAAVERGRSGERYILSSSEPVTLREIFQKLEKLTGIRAPRLRVPYGILFGMTYLDELFSHYVFRKKTLMPTEGVRFCKATGFYDNSKAIRELGYQPTPLEKTLRKAVDWYRKNGYVEARGFFRIRANGSNIISKVMRRLGLSGYTDKLNPGTLFFYAIVKMLMWLKKLGMGRARDGWRGVAQCYLRTEQAKFGLAAFNLDLWSDFQGFHEKTFENARRHAMERLAKFIRGQSLFRQGLRWSLFCARSYPRTFADLVAAEFDEKGFWVRLEPWMDPERGDFEEMPAETKALLLAGLMEILNQTKDTADKKRPLVIKKKWRRWFSRHRDQIPAAWREDAEDYGRRILGASFICFEVLPQERDSVGESDRFRVPFFTQYRLPGCGTLAIVCRFTPAFDGADLWFHFSHVSMDGVPSQEILNELKRQWGTRGDFLFPSSGFRPGKIPDLCSLDGKNEICHAYQFLDFQPFLKVRNDLNKRFGRRAKQVISSAALLIWKLAQYREFEDVKFAVPVDLRATPERERTLGFIFIRPSIYLDKHRSDRGFFAFQQEFNRQLFATRKRRSESYRLLESYTVVPPAFYAVTSKCLMRPLQEFTGTLGITIIKKADFFVAPASDVHTDGFIAFSNFSLPSAGGGKVGVVSMKGPKEKIRGYMDVLRDIMQRAIQHDELYF